MQANAGSTVDVVALRNFKNIKIVRHLVKMFIKSAECLSSVADHLENIVVVGNLD